MFAQKSFIPKYYHTIRIKLKNKLIKIENEEKKTKIELIKLYLNENLTKEKYFITNKKTIFFVVVEINDFTFIFRHGVDATNYATERRRSTTIYS